MRAVLDANVYVSAAFTPNGKPGKVLRTARTGLFDLVISEPIMDEIDRVFRYPKIQKQLGWSSDEIAAFLSELKKFATLTPGSVTLDVVADDPSDNRYLECAVEGKAEYVVSGDTDLLKLGEYEGIKIVTPTEFLEVLRQQSSER